MVKVRLEDVELLNQLINQTDNRLDKLTTSLLTIYGAVTSGLFVLVFNMETSEALKSSNEKLTFAIIFITASLVVLLSALHKVLMYFTSKQVGDMHAKRMREEDYSGDVLSPKEWTAQTIMALRGTLLALIVVNAISILVFVLTKVYKQTKKRPFGR